MKAKVVAETPTEKVVESKRREIVNMHSVPAILGTSILTPVGSAMAFSSFVGDNPIMGAGIAAGTTLTFFLLAQGRSFNAMVKHYAGVGQTKSDFKKLLNEGDRLEIGEVQYTRFPNLFLKDTLLSNKYAMKQLSTHQVKSFVKKTKGKIVFEQVLTELPMKTWGHTFDELLQNDGIEEQDVASFKIPAGTGYFDAQSKGTIDEYKAKLDAGEPVAIEA